MTQIELEKLILKKTKGLPDYALSEVVDFIQFIKGRTLRKKKAKFIDSLTAELSLLNSKESVHLEKEFKDYKELYPREK